MDFTMLNLLKKYEPDYAADNYCGLQDEPIHRFYDNRSTLIFSAPHATRTFRGHAVKKPDLYTGALARTAAIDSGTSALTRRRFAAEKHSITDFITAQRLQNHHFLDIHGMSGERVLNWRSAPAFCHHRSMAPFWRKLPRWPTNTKSAGSSIIPTTPDVSA